MLYVIINSAQGVPGFGLAFLRPNYGQAYNNNNNNKEMQDRPNEVQPAQGIPHIFYEKLQQKLAEAKAR